MTRQELLEKIKKADYEYYVLDNPTLSDAEYDKLRREYIEQYGSADLDYVAGGVSDAFETFAHPVPVTSLGKWTDGADDEQEFNNKVEALLPVEIQPKFDGLTVVAYPNPDGSCKFVTRGLHGELGEVLPNFLPQYEGAGVNNSGHGIRGEVFITKANFEKLNQQLVASGKEPMKNLRNTASGILRRKERSEFLNLLSFVTYDIPDLDKTPAEMRKIVTEQTKFEFANGTPYRKLESVLKGVRETYDWLVEKSDYPVDGVVIKSCQENSSAKFGNTNHHPRNAFAYKPIAQKHVTTVRDVIWQMGRSRVTPVAVVDPVEIDGAIVTKASLHNIENIKKLGIKINAKVEIIKANEIIPFITKVVEEGDSEINTDVCPSCGSPLVENNGQYFCTNPDCEEKIAQTIAFLGQKDVLNISGLSVATARKIVETYPEKIKVFKQNIIFELSKEEFESLSGFATKSAEKLYNAVQQACKNVELPKFIKAMCVLGIGGDVGKILADKFGSLEEIVNAYMKHYDWTQLDGIGEKTAKALNSKSFLMAMEIKKYISIKPYHKKEVSGAFANKVFVLTGKMEYPRQYYVDKIEAVGGKEGNSVTSNTDYLVIADINSQSSKAKKAREFGITLISPEELLDMI